LLRSTRHSFLHMGQRFPHQLPVRQASSPPMLHYALKMDFLIHTSNTWRILKLLHRFSSHWTVVFLRMLFISIKNVKTWHELSVNSDRYSGYVRVDSENGVTRYDIPIQILENDNEYNSIIKSLSKTYMNYSCRWDLHNAFTIHINRKTHAFRLFISQTRR